MLSVGSLCTGYGGLEMGLQAVYGDIDLRFVSDIDEDASTLLAHHHPKVPNLGDLTVIDWADIEPVDVLCAGYPCQPFSTAGKRKGLDDERAIFKYIADAISVLRPKHVLLENVAGHLTIGATAVIATLTRLGYNTRWGIVRASDTGAPHKRARLFIWADTTNANSARLQRLRGECELAEDSGQKRFTWGDYEPAIQRWETVMGRPAPHPAHKKGVNTVFVEWLMGLPEGYVTDTGLSRKAQLKILGNGVVPQQAEFAINTLWGFNA
jgi:DNA (cytosine-5)-methyltransferase 1